MRILFLVDGYFPGVGGAEIQATLLAKTLMKRGHEVLVVAPHLKPELPLIDTVEGIAVRRIGYVRVPKLSNIFYTLSFALFMIKHGREHDAYHIHMVHKMASVVALLRPWLGKPVLAKVSGATEFEGGVLDFRKDAFYHRWLRKLLMRIDYFQSLSSYSQQQILKAGAEPHQVVMLANGINTSLYPLSTALHGDLADDNSPTVIAYCGRLEPVKALPVLLRAVARLCEQGRDNFVLRLAGDGDDADALKAQCAELNLQARVEFCGRISDVAGFLANAHVYVQVSRYEGLSNSVIEAMCSGLVPVLTRISGNEDLVVHGESGFLIEVDDDADLARQLAALIGDRERCRILGRAARSRVERLCALEHVVSSLEHLYAGDAASLSAPQSSIEER